MQELLAFAAAYPVLAAIALVIIAAGAADIVHSLVALVRGWPDNE